MNEFAVGTWHAKLTWRRVWDEPRYDPAVQVVLKAQSATAYPGNTSFVTTDTDLIQVDQHICRILINAVRADLLKFFSAVAP